MGKVSNLNFLLPMPWRLLFFRKILMRIEPGII